MRTNVDISPKILEWVLSQVRNRTTNDVIETIQIWIKGEKPPTFNQVEKISKATGVPLGYLFLKTPPVEDKSLIEFRTIDSVDLENPSRNLMDTIHDMGQIQDWIREYLISEGASKLSFVGECSSQNDSITFAKKVREILRIDNDWYVGAKENPFNYIRNKISDVGVVVMMSGIVGNNTHRPLDIDEFRAFAVVDDYAPLIFINAKDSANAKLFSLLHEFSHICIGQNSLYNDRYSSNTNIKKAETLCNAVAAEVLVPHDAFLSAWDSFSVVEDCAEKIKLVAKQFNCGMTVIARKAFDSNFISYNDYIAIAQKGIELYNAAQRKQKGKGGNYYNTAASRIDQRFFYMLLGSVQSGKTLYSDAFRLTNTNRTTFASLAQKAGGDLR